MTIGGNNGHPHSQVCAIRWVSAMGWKKPLSGK
jgi:hypothetical protein